MLLLFEMWLDYLFCVLGWDPETLQCMLNMNISIRNRCDNMHDETWARAEVFPGPGFGEQETSNRIRNSIVSSAFTTQGKIKWLKMPVFQFCWCSHSCCHLETGCSETMDKWQLHIFNRLKQDACICCMQANQLLVHAVFGTYHFFRHISVDRLEKMCTSLTDILYFSISAY